MLTSLPWRFWSTCLKKETSSPPSLSTGLGRNCLLFWRRWSSTKGWLGRGRGMGKVRCPLSVVRCTRGAKVATFGRSRTAGPTEDERLLQVHGHDDVEEVGAALEEAGGGWGG